MREFLNPNVSLLGLNICLCRREGGSFFDLKAEHDKPMHSCFKAYELGYIHIELKYLPKIANQTSRRYLFVAIERFTLFVFIEVYRNQTAANGRSFLRALERACPIHICNM